MRNSYSLSLRGGVGVRHIGLPKTGGANLMRSHDAPVFGTAPETDDGCSTFTLSVRHGWRCLARRPVIRTHRIRRQMTLASGVLTPFLNLAIE